ncbi:protein-glucosylgalactosylhydroxylysine glucosidase isoform X2 [Vombatus ursinus]|uniref:protein-glucosylgalactosylhydroxylysine glucosidase isoform X2 n=1 Tax=Vombatus ursinus TaxID=29139 RepID=UPI000FFD0253|nr:protein-glucosylgalactosylhydroxylysine glucosidase isoform X2 [Vombatus ursinus]
MEDDPTVFTTHSLPKDPRLLATVTNSYLGTQVYHHILHVSGVYNGAGGDTHRADVPSPLNVHLLAPACQGDSIEETFALDTKTGTFLHTLRGPDFLASHRIYAHRVLSHLLVSSVSIGHLGSTSQPITVYLQADFTPHSPDLALHLGPDFRGARYLYGRTLVPEEPGGSRPEVHMLWTPVPPSLTLSEAEEQTQTWDFLTVVGGSKEEAEGHFLEAASLQGAGALYSSHADAWGSLWEACALDLVGSFPLQQTLRGCLYYTLSALPHLGASEPFHGLSPGGLSNGRQGQCYWGHIFWDQDFWMFPSILLLDPEAARSILEYRVRTLGGALLNAEELGFQGAKFAWESASSGREVCPEEIYGTQEIHINGAVMLAFQLYYQATQDLQLFQEAGGWNVVRAVADFWCSRVTWCAEEQNYHLRGVMPPDEYHSGVNNSVYTNVIAQTSLHFAADLARDLGQPVPEQWAKVAEKIKVPFDPERNYHPEFDGYEPGETVKQADVVLLGYPVPYPLSLDVRRKNLEIYEAVTSSEGPAMSWSMFAVGWMELKEMEKAHAQLRKCFSNISEPFKVWTENADGSGAVNFLTGMGGFLQAALFGFTGFRITRAGLTFDPTCSAEVRSMRVTGVSYLGNRLCFSFSEEMVTIVVTASEQAGALPLEVELRTSGKRLPLSLVHLT